MRRRTLFLSAILTTLVLCGAETAVRGSAAPDIRAVQEELKLRLLEMINEDRAAAGRGPVVYDVALSRAADEHCRDMLAGNYMSHWDREGRKPYLRYSQAGIRGATQENVWSLWKFPFDQDPEQIWYHMRSAHANFMAEKPPNDGHRQSILHPRHTHAGIGVAFDESGMRLVELFETRATDLNALPARATLKDSLTVRGRVTQPGLELFAISIFYEPLPRPLARAELNLTGPYGMPSDERTERLSLQRGIYLDGSRGRIDVRRVGKGVEFTMPLNFWRKAAGVYTVVVWVRPENEREGFMGAMTSVLVQDAEKVF